jgi:predicted transcriptional regulator
MDTAPKQPLTVKLAPELRAQLAALAVRDDRSLSWIASAAIKAYLARRAANEPPQ